MDSATDRRLTRMREAIEGHFRGELELGLLVRRLERLIARVTVRPAEWRDEFIVSWLQLEQLAVERNQHIVNRVLSRLLAMVELQLIARRS